MTPEGQDALRQGARMLGLEVQEQMQQFSLLLDLLQQGQAKQNLTALKTERDIVIKHFIDSLSCLMGNHLQGANCLLDLGTGAGFPSLPLAIMHPQLAIRPLDATRKKIEFVQATAQALGLRNVQALVGRAEVLGHEQAHRAQYSHVVARAVSSLPTLAELGLPLLSVGGLLIAQKGAISDKELAAGAQAAEQLGGEVIEVQHFELPLLGDARSLVIMAKTKATPTRYPRRDGIPAQQPLFWEAKQPQSATTLGIQKGQAKRK